VRPRAALAVFLGVLVELVPSWMPGEFKIGIANAHAEATSVSLLKNIQIGDIPEEVFRVAGRKFSVLTSSLTLAPQKTKSPLYKALSESGSSLPTSP
jgi:hypothetical protein